MENLLYLLIKENFGDQLKNEFTEIIELIKEFFIMIKEVTYDIAVNYIGVDATNIVLIGVGAVAIMIIAMAIINR